MSYRVIDPDDNEAVDVDSVDAIRGPTGRQAGSLPDR
jgi:hypothetical protein